MRRDPLIAVQALQRKVGNAALANALQRKVGFEFQCRNWQFYKRQRQRGEEQEEEFDTGRGTYVYDGNGWHLESDGGEPEFVVDAVDESTGQLPQQAVNSITTFANGFTAQGRTIQDHFSDRRKTLLIKPKNANAVEPTVTADPQVTAGVRYDRLSTFMSVISQRIPAGDHTPTQSLTEGSRLVQNTAVQHYKRDDLMVGAMIPAVRDRLARLLNPGRFAHGQLRFGPAPAPAATDAQIEAVVGILTLLATYLRKAPELGRALMKDMPLLAKSDLGTAVRASPLFDWLQAGPLQTQLYALTALAYPDPNPLHSIRAALEDTLVEASGRNLAEQVYPGGGQNAGPTIRQWLDDLLSLNPVDRLSSRTTWLADASMGPWNRVDTVGPLASRSAAPIIEMRRIRNAMPKDQWSGFAVAVTKWVKRLNDPTEGQTADEFGRALDYRLG